MRTFHSITGLLALVLLVAPTLAAEEHPDRLELQISHLVGALEGKRVGLLTNPTGVDSQYRLIADRLHEHPDVELGAFFAPEHGIRGDRQAGVHEQDFVDPQTGVTVYSLYGPRREPTADQLADLDAVIFDIQDVGARFYTYVWTMTYVMEACAQHGKEFIVFDRPNPIGLDRVEGAPITFDAGLIGRKWGSSPIGVATRHGMTAGEIATLVNEEWMDPKVDLTVIKVPGLTRTMTFAETGYPWVFPSPNMPTIDTAMVYTGTCIFEGVNVSEGRGTTRPFELFGAPWIDGTAYADALNALGLPGCRFRPAWFRPSFSTHSGQLCGGVQLHVTDPDAFRPVETGLHALKVLLEMYPEETTVQSFASRLMGIENLHTRILNEDVQTFIDEWEDNMETFLELRDKHLLYGNNSQGWMAR